MKPTLRSVAEAVGVTPATVSIVLNGSSGRVSAITRERVIAEAKRQHYTPNLSARATRKGRTDLVVLSLRMMEDPWSLAVLEAVNERATKAGMAAVILADGRWFEAVSRHDSDVAYIDADTDTELGRKQVRELVKQGRRLVVFNPWIEPDGFQVVRSSAVPGARMIAQHFLELGHERIGALCGVGLVEDPGPTRLTAFGEALKAADLAVPDNWLEPFTNSQVSAYAAATRLLSAPERPSAVFATTDFAALAAINAAHRLGLRVPEDVAVAGLGNTLVGEQSQPSLTTAGPIGFYERLADIIVDTGRGEMELGQAFDFEWKLYQRESTTGETCASE